MVSIRLTKVAWNDLNSITDYISLDSPHYAEQFANKIFDRLEVLHTFNQSGRIVPEFENANIRELILSSYRIVYRIESEEVIVVLRIVHGAKLLN